MPEPIRPIRLEEVDWRSVLGWTRLLGCFRMAIHPPKLFTALLLVVLLYLGGVLMDSIFIKARVTSDEFDLYPASAPIFNRNGDLASRGVFESAMYRALKGFSGLMSATTQLKFGFAELLYQGKPQPDTVAAALDDLFINLPAVLFRKHPYFSSLYCLYGMVVWSLLAGAIARMSALHATRNLHPSAGAALRFAFSRWLWFFLTPLLPLIAVLLIGLVLAGGGLLLNWPGTDIIGGLFFALALLGGVVIALLLIGIGAGAHILYPAIAVEGADGLDALTRAYNYVLGRPWRWLFYNLVALVYGAITYLFFGSVIFLALLMTHEFVSWGVFRQVHTRGSDYNRFDLMLPPPRIGELAYQIDWQALPWTVRITAGLIAVWGSLLIGLLGAYAISYYQCSNTWIYLLLRRAADGTDFSAVSLDKEPPGEGSVALAPPTPDEVEPPADAPAGPQPPAPPADK